MKTAVIVAGLIALSACAPAEPVVTDFNGDSVKIYQFNFAGEGARHQGTDAEADRICAKRGRTAEYASTRVVGDGQLEFLYLCL